MQTWLLFTVVAINALTFCCFGTDKWLATKGRRRIPEARLLAMAWATGLIGGWVGMSVFRHKTAQVELRGEDGGRVTRAQSDVAGACTSG